jgi:hypothetical protein
MNAGNLAWKDNELSGAGREMYVMEERKILL